MGYIASSTTTTVTARLTPYGRKKLLSTTGADFVSSFVLGDSDANYQTNQVLSSGQVPGEGGNLNSVSGTTNSVSDNISVRNKLIYNLSETFKPVGVGSFNINESQSYLGTVTITGDTMSQDLIDRTDYTVNSLVNTFNTFGLPLKSSDIVKFTTTTNTNNGYSDTAISSLGNADVLVMSIPNAQYGEVIDAKTIQLGITTSAATYTCYAAYQRTSTSVGDQDANMRETSSNTTPAIGDNIAFLFSDGINRPNGDATKSWATGYGSAKPYSVAGKQLFNYVDNSASSLTADTAIGVAYLDKGFIVITDSTIIGEYVEATDSSASTLTYNSLTTDITQNIVCDALVSEFRMSMNPTFTYGVDTPRVTEIGLYDSTNTLVAVGKLNAPHLLNNMYFRIEVNISV